MDTKFVQGADKLARRIRTIRERLDLPPMVEEISTLLWKRTLIRFDQEVDPDGQDWPDLAPSTEERKARAGQGGRKKLVQSGMLRASIQVIKGGAGSTFINTGAGFRIGVDGNAKGERGPVAVYAGVQNRGDRAHNLPARRFLGIGRLDVKAVDSFLRRKGQQALEE